MFPFRFLGTESQIGSKQLDKFGQRVELSQEDFENAVRGKCPIIPEADFVKLFPKDSDVAPFAQVSSHAEAPAAFLEQKKAALAVFHGIRTSLIAAPEANPNPETEVTRLKETFAAVDAANAEADAPKGRKKGA